MIEVTPVRSGKDLDRFVKFPWKIYKGDPAWVPPLIHDVKLLLNREKHPFHQHATVEYFLARRNGEIVGRIAAIVNHLHNEFHGDRVGFFGFFECIDDQRVADALFGTAEEWLRDKGMDTSRGPMNFSTNEECGLLIDAFDQSPVIMMTYNPAYYVSLVERAGYAKAKDLLAYYSRSLQVPEVLTKRVARMRTAEGVTIRHADMKRFDEEVKILKDIYNSAWEKNWGFVPMTDAEFEFMARQLKPVAEPSLIPIAEVDGKPVAFAVGLPDLNVAIKHMNGRLFPFGILKLFWYKRKIALTRAITLGVRPEYRKRGIDTMLYLRLYEASIANGAPAGEGSWILEDNWEMRRGMERFGGHHYKTYRIYDKPLNV